MSSALHVEDRNEFAALGLLPSLCNAVRKMGFLAPTPIQDQSIAALLSGRDVLGQAATGTGKTAAFGLPLLQRVLQQSQGAKRGQADALVLVPTRELAIQVAKALTAFSDGSALRVVAVYGGQDMRLQLQALAAGASIVVATPGRLIDHLQRRSLSLQATHTVVLDEADEMLDRGFADDLADIFASLPQERQTAMFSATLSHHVIRMAQRALHDPVQIRVAQKAQVPGGNSGIAHAAYLVPPAQRAAALGRLLHLYEPQAALIFCRTRADVDTLCQTLSRSGQRCEALHGGMLQGARDKVMRHFTRKEITLLVATDVAARGLDIDHISHVVNYDMPESLEVYMHRVGRTGRAGRTGTALSFVHPGQRHVVARLKAQMGVEVAQKDLPSPAEVADLRADKTLATVEATAVRVAKAAPTPKLAQHAEDLASRYSAADLAAVVLHLAQGDAESGPNAERSAGELGMKWSSRAPSGGGGAGRPNPRHRRFGGGGGRPPGRPNGPRH